MNDEEIYKTLADTAMQLEGLADERILHMLRDDGDGLTPGEKVLTLETAIKMYDMVDQLNVWASEFE